MYKNQGRLIAALSTQFRDIDLAEDVLQDALSAALMHWPDKGVPGNPEGWLYQTAKRKALDRFRRRATRRAKSGDYAYQTRLNNQLNNMDDEDDIAENHSIPDERLRLIFTCCHPALPEIAHTALTLKTVCGLSSGQIASAYLVPETTMAQRIVRAKNKIKKAGIPFEIPGAELWPQRWASVLSVIYLIFNAGYSTLPSADGEPEGAVDLCAEALRLGYLLVDLLPEETEVSGLLALMLLSRARQPARLVNPEIYISLQDQDRKLWKQDEIIRGQKLLLQTLSKGRPGAYQVQAAISAVHCEAASFAETDWQEITALYERLYAYEPTPVVMLNASVALSFAESPTVGLASLELVGESKQMQHYQPYYAARADMLRRDGQLALAKTAYQQAYDLSGARQEKQYLAKLMAAL